MLIYSVDQGGRWHTGHAAQGAMATETVPVVTTNKEKLQPLVPGQRKSADRTSSALTKHPKADVFFPGEI